MVRIAIATLLVLLTRAGEANPSVAGETAPELPPRAPGLTLPRGGLVASVTLEVDASADRFGEPTSIAPDLAYGITDDLTVSVVHSKFAVTGFRAGAGNGLCVTEEGCPSTYRNVGAEVLYGVLRGPFALAAGAGVHALDLEAGFYGVKLGMRARYQTGRLGIVASPSVIVAVSEREDAMGARRNQDTVWVPIVVTYKVIAPLALGLGSGLKGVATDLGDTWEVPLGLSAQWVIDPRWSLAASFVFGRLTGGLPDELLGTASRGIQVWATFTR